MPTSWTDGSPEKERAWERAKARVREQYPKIKEDSDRFYRLTMAIAKNMAGEKNAAARDDTPAFIAELVRRRLGRPRKTGRSLVDRLTEKKAAATAGEIKEEIDRAAEVFDPKKVHIDRPKGTPKKTPKGEIIYPTDYGEMKNLKAKGDGEGFDVFVLPGEKITKSTKPLAGTHTREGEPKLIVGKKWDKKKIDEILGFMQRMFYAYKDRTYTPRLFKIKAPTSKETA